MSDGLTNFQQASWADALRIVSSYQPSDAAPRTFVVQLEAYEEVQKEHVKSAEQFVGHGKRWTP